MSLQLIPPDINLDFVGKRYFFVALSTAINLLAIVLLLTKGLNYGVDFVGGSVAQIEFTQKHQRRRDSQGARATRSGRSLRSGFRQGRAVLPRALRDRQEHRQHRAQARDCARQSVRAGRREGGARRNRRRQGRQRPAPQGLRRRHHRDHLHGRLYRDPVPPRELEFRRGRGDRVDSRRAGRDVRAGHLAVPVRSDDARRGADRHRLLGA